MRVKRREAVEGVKSHGRGGKGDGLKGKKNGDLRDAASSEAVSPLCHDGLDLAPVGSRLLAALRHSNGKEEVANRLGVPAGLGRHFC